MATGNMHKNLVKFCQLVFVLCQLTDRQKQACSSQYFAPLAGLCNKEIADSRLRPSVCNFDEYLQSSIEHNVLKSRLLCILSPTQAS